MNTYFSANKSLKGGALFVSWNSKEGNIYHKLFSQVANDQNDKSKNFDWKNAIFVKLSQDEAADVVRAIRTNGESKFYHTFENQVCTGTLKYYEIDGEKGKRKGFLMAVKKEEREIKVGFSLGAAERLSLLHQHALSHIFDSEYSVEIQKNKEYAKKKEESKSSKLVVEPATVSDNTTSEPVEENPDDLF